MWVFKYRVVTKLATIDVGRQTIALASKNAIFKY